jgi:hypothetical protein
MQSLVRSRYSKERTTFLILTKNYSSPIAFPQRILKNYPTGLEAQIGQRFRMLEMHRLSRCTSYHVCPPARPNLIGVV